MMRKRLILIVLAVIIVGGVVLVLATSKQGTKKAQTSTAAAPISFTKTTPKSATNKTPASATGTLPTPTTAEIQADIIAQANTPTIQDGTFTISSTQEAAPGWFIVKISSQDGNNATMVFKQLSDGSLILVAGPGTALALSVLQANGAPDAILNTAPVFDDEQ